MLCSVMFNSVCVNCFSLHVPQTMFVVGYTVFLFVFSSVCDNLLFIMIEFHKKFQEN